MRFYRQIGNKALICVLKINKTVIQTSQKIQAKFYRHL